jgi:hypothetical protein
MTAGQTTRRMSNVSLAPAPLAGLLAAALVTGAMLGAGITLQVGSTASNAALAGAAAQPAPTFDAAGFRAEERAPLTGFDDVTFRAEEREVLVTKFDDVKFRAEERGDLVADPGAGAAGSEHLERRGGK